LFAASPEWAQASTTQAHFALTHPSDAPHARVTWSLRALQRVPKLFLLISGARKLAVLQQAVAGLSSQPVVTVENAISKLACHEGVHLDVYWCAE
jgi:6-phosphogluconolactonase